MDTFTRRELFRRIGRAAIAGPVVLATRDQQAGLLLRLANVFGKRSAVGQWLRELVYDWW